jgi:hypothetical protein
MLSIVQNEDRIPKQALKKNGSDEGILKPGRKDGPITLFRQ